MIGRADVALLLADLDLGPLLVQHHQPRRGDHVGVADRLQGFEEGAQVAVEEAELQAAVRRTSTSPARPAACPSRTAMLSFCRSSSKLTPNLSSSSSLHAEDHRLDGHLHRADVDLGHHLVDLGQHGLVVADQHARRRRRSRRRRPRESSVPMPTSAGDETLTTPTFSVSSGGISACSSAAVT